MMNMVRERVALRFIRDDVMAELRWAKATRREACSCMPDHGRMGIAHVLARLASFTCAIAVAASLASAARADSATEQPAATFDASARYHTEYEVVWGVDERLCQAMAKLANENLDSGGNLNFRTRERFESVHWEDVDWRFTGKPINSKPRLGYVAEVDIDNDGRIDRVMREEWSLGQLNGEDLAVLDQDYFADRAAGYYIPIERWRSFPGLTFSRLKETLDLRQLPAQTKRLMGEPESGRTLSMYAPHIYVTQFDERTHVLLQEVVFPDEEPSAREALSLRESNWILVGAYSNEQLHTRRGETRNKVTHECYLRPQVEQN